MRKLSNFFECLRMHPGRNTVHFYLAVKWIHFSFRGRISSPCAQTSIILTAWEKSGIKNIVRISLPKMLIYLSTVTIEGRNQVEFMTIIYQKMNGIGTVTLNRLDHLNALSVQMIEEMNSLFDEMEKDSDIWVAILTGGMEVFSAGANLKEDRTPDILERFNKFFNKLECFPKPVIAAISGYCLGGGLEMALCCDLRIASETARIGTTEVKVGTIPAAGATWRLPRLIGISRAKEMIYLGEYVDGKKAYEFGLVNKVVPEGEVMREAQSLAATLLERSPVTLKAAKACIQLVMQSELSACLTNVLRWRNTIQKSEDFAEGIKAYIEKRKPIWKGR
jgi:enoyl-CoA hydratase